MRFEIIGGHLYRGNTVVASSTDYNWLLELKAHYIGNVVHGRHWNTK